MPLLGIVAEFKKFPTFTKINLWRKPATREREECIFITLKIAKRKRYKNAVGGVVLAVIQIAVDSDLAPNNGASAFNTRVAR